MIDEAYVRELLAAAEKQAPMTPREFEAFCRRDINAGYRAEVAAASRRYFLRHGDRIRRPQVK
jgi:hypothetical protein